MQPISIFRKQRFSWNPALRRRPSSVRRYRIDLERLEDRTLPATVFWTAPGSGNWTTPTNWSTGTLPGPDDDVIIDVPGSVATITYSSGTHAVRSLTANANLLLSGGMLSIATTLQASANVTFEGATLVNATVTAGTTLTASRFGGTLQNVTLNGTLNLTALSGVFLRVVDGLTLNGTINVGGTGTRRVRGRISDKDGGFTDYWTTIPIVNAAPTAWFSNDGPVAAATRSGSRSGSALPAG